MKLLKPNKSSPYFRVEFYGEDILGYASFYDDKAIIKNSHQHPVAFQVYLSKTNLHKLKELLN